MKSIPKQLSSIIDSSIKNKYFEHNLHSLHFILIICFCIYTIFPFIIINFFNYLLYSIWYFSVHLFNCFFFHFYQR